MIAPTPLLTILISDAHGFDHCAMGEVIRKIKRQGYWSPYLQAMVDEYLSECDVCAQNNVRKGISAPIGHIPVPEGPFKHLVMDYVDMIRTVRGKILVMLSQSGHYNWHCCCCVSFVVLFSVVLCLSSDQCWPVLQPNR